MPTRLFCTSISQSDTTAVRLGCWVRLSSGNYIWIQAFYTLIAT